jgi:hypothetical protein
MTGRTRSPHGSQLRIPPNAGAQMVVLPLEGTRFAARLILANPCLGKRAPYVRQFLKTFGYFCKTGNL